MSKANIITQSYKNRFFNLLESKMGDSKPIISEDRVSTFELLRYKDAFINFVDKLNLVLDTEDVCNNMEQASKKISDSLNDLLSRISIDHNINKQEVIKTLYDRLNSTFITTVVSIASPIIKNYNKMNDTEPILSEEVLNLVFNEIRTKYGEQGAALNSMIGEILIELGINVESVC